MLVCCFRGLHDALHVQAYGPRNWSVIAAGIRGRSGKSCRLRWCNQLNPDVKKDAFSDWEDAVIVKSHKVTCHDC